MENYSLVKRIGKGSFGEVWLIEHLKNKKQFILKQICLENTSKKEQRAAYLEAKLLSTLKHPNIVSYLDSFQTSDGCLNIIMGYCEKGDLYRFIRDRKGMKLEESQVVEWFIQICMALKYLHDLHILHRDLKTQNIFLTRSKIIKVGDLGIARVLDGTCDMATTIIGTPYYMSPELFNNKPYNHKSDVWALGCCVLEMVTLRHAFNARDLNSLMYKVLGGKIPSMPQKYDPELLKLIHSMLSNDPAERPSVASILETPYIRKHIEQFLRDSKYRQDQQSQVRKNFPSAIKTSSVEECSTKMKNSHNTNDVFDYCKQSEAKKESVESDASKIATTGIKPFSKLNSAVNCIGEKTFIICKPAESMSKDCHFSRKDVIAQMNDDFNISPDINIIGSKCTNNSTFIKEETFSGSNLSILNDRRQDKINDITYVVNEKYSSFDDESSRYSKCNLNLIPAGPTTDISFSHPSYGKEGIKESAVMQNILEPMQLPQKKSFTKETLPFGSAPSNFSIMEDNECSSEGLSYAKKINIGENIPDPMQCNVGETSVVVPKNNFAKVSSPVESSTSFLPESLATNSSSSEMPHDSFLTNLAPIDNKLHDNYIVNILSSPKVLKKSLKVSNISQPIKNDSDEKHEVFYNTKPLKGSEEIDMDHFEVPVLSEAACSDANSCNNEDTSLKLVYEITSKQIDNFNCNHKLDSLQQNSCSSNVKSPLQNVYCSHISSPKNRKIMSEIAHIKKASQEQNTCGNFPQNTTKTKITRHRPLPQLPDYGKQYEQIPSLEMHDHSEGKIFINHINAHKQKSVNPNHFDKDIEVKYPLDENIHKESLFIFDGDKDQHFVASHKAHFSSFMSHRPNSAARRRRRDKLNHQIICKEPRTSRPKSAPSWIGKSTVRTEYDSSASLQSYSEELLAISEGQIKKKETIFSEPDNKVIEENQMEEQEDIEVEMTEFITLLNTTLSIRGVQDGRETAQHIVKTTMERNNIDNKKAKKNSLDSSRLMQRTDMLRSDCTHVLGEDLLNKALDIVEKKQSKEMEALLKELLGAHFHHYAGKILELRFCEKAL